MKIGYARVSTADQNTALQIDSLKKFGCKKIYEEKQSGGKRDRAELNNCLKSLREGDVLVVWKLDRLARSLKHLIDVVTSLDDENIGFQSVTEKIDTTNAQGKLTFHLFGALAEFEKDLITERVKAGLAIAKKNGKHFGRPQSLSKNDISLATSMFIGGTTKADIAKHFNVTRQTIYSVFKDAETDNKNA